MCDNLPMITSTGVENPRPGVVASPQPKGAAKRKQTSAATSAPSPQHVLPPGASPIPSAKSKVTIEPAVSPNKQEGIRITVV